MSKFFRADRLLPLLAFTSTALANPVVGGTNNPIDVVKGGFCGAGGIVGLISNPAFVGIALMLLMFYFGWSIKTGNPNAIQIVTRGLVGAVVVLGAVTIAGMFVQGC